MLWKHQDYPIHISLIYKGYYEILNNVQVARLFGNTALGIGGISVDMEVFGRALTVRPVVEIGEALVNDFFTANGQVKDKGELEEQWRMQLNWAEYLGFEVC